GRREVGSLHSVSALRATPLPGRRKQPDAEKRRALAYFVNHTLKGFRLKQFLIQWCSHVRVMLPYRLLRTSSGKQRSRPQATKVVAFSWASRREAADHGEQKQETETGSAENQARPSRSGSCQSRRAC